MNWSSRCDAAVGVTHHRTDYIGGGGGGGLFSVFLLLILVISSMVEPSNCAFKGDHRLLSPNVTRLLNDLLATDRYDKRIRPDFGGNPVKIGVNMYIKSLGPVSETDEWYSMDCYFRQHWYDSRLRFNLTGLDEFSMNWLFLERVWKPDTYFMNGKKSYLHRITVPNKFLRISSDGLLTYSMRLTIKASCKMHLRKFPFDSQICPLLIGSYGYSSSDVLYHWRGDQPVGLEEGVNLAQYDLIQTKTETLQGSPEQAMMRRDRRKHEDFSVIKVKFYLKRHTGYFMLQVYVPCGLIVSCSWVSFWIDPDAVPARVSLGVTTVLSMTTMGFGGRSQLPKVSYRTALDWFVILCFSFVFAVMVEYAAINFIDTLTTELKKLIEDRRKAAAAAAQAQREKEAREGGDSDDETAEKEGIVKPALVKMTLATAMAVATMAGAGLAPPPMECKDVGADRLPGSSSEEEEEDEEEEERDPDKWDGPPIPIIVIDNVDDVESMGNTPIPPQRGATLPVCSRFIACLAEHLRRWQAFHFLPREDDASLNEPKEKFSRIDRESRKIFPFLFAVFISVYWFVYMYYMTDEIVQPEAVNKPRS